MKWIVWVLAIAAVLIGLEFVFGDSDRNQPISHDPLAVSLYEDGLQDLFALRFNDAVTKLERALELDPGFAEAGIALAGAYSRLGMTQETKAAMALADSLTESIPGDRRRMLAQVRICRNSAATSFPIRDSLMTRLAREEPENIFVLEALAMDARSRSDMDEAERIWKRILEFDPNYANSYNQLGYLELGRGNYESAINHMQKYAFLSPGMANTHDSLGDVYMAMGRYDEAESEYKLALSKQPDFFYALIHLGQTYIARGQLKSGLDLLHQVSSKMAGTEFEMEIDQGILMSYLNAGLLDELQEANSKFIAKYPDSGRTVINRAVQLVYRGRSAESRALMDSVLTVRRTSLKYRTSPRTRLRTESESMLYEAIAADVLLDAPARVKAWQKIVDFVEDKFPFQEQWYYRRHLAQALLDAGRPDDALSALQPMLSVNSNLFYCLEIAVHSSLALRDATGARQFMDQLRWSLRDADRDLPIVKRASALEALVTELESRS